MKMWGVDDKELDRIRQTIVNGSERLLDRIIEYECSLSSDVRGGAGAETDLIGRLSTERYTPYASAAGMLLHIIGKFTVNFEA
jgi:hypothetical protein